MKALLLVALVGAVLYAGYAAVRFGGKYQASKRLISEARGYERHEASGASLLVLGDSTAVGVGASRPEESVAGRFALARNAGHVENRASSGALIADIEGQIARASRSEYDAILIQIGGNDIIRFHGAKAEARRLEAALAALPLAKEVYLMSAGNVGAATIFPRAVRGFHTRLNLAYHEALREAAGRLGITYVDLYEEPAEDPFVARPDVYLAADGLHPTSAGYELWFKALERSRAGGQ